jgi:DNA-binding transcriptional MerR regulator
MITKNKRKTEGYRIGAVSRFTGISSDKLRIWERRYQAVTPARTDSGDRHYSDEDVGRLRLMKMLVDSGDSISSIAALNEIQLQKRLTSNQPVPAPQTGEPCSLVVIGESVVEAMEASRELLTQVRLVQCFNNAASFQAQAPVHAKELKADALVIELATLHADTAIRINDWINQLQAHTAIVIYRFAARHALKQLPAAKCITLRAPVDAMTIQQQCINRTTASTAIAADSSQLPFITGDTVPARQFDDETLARLAQCSTSVKCECPLHLSELISSLSAFEKYSSECESRNARDAALHSYLNETASRARYMIETALGKVIELDDIKL